MTNRQLILSAIRTKPGQTDAELRSTTGVEPHQQVNMICRGLEREGLIRRAPGPRGRIVNTPLPPTDVADDNDVHHAREHQRDLATPRPQDPASAVAAVNRDLATPSVPAASDALILLTCSGRKAVGGDRETGPSILDYLQSGLSTQLRDARRAVAVKSSVDATRLMPAWLRYTGAAYERSRSQIRDALQRDTDMAILSGGYGVVLPSERIGYYDREFTPGDWPKGLLQQCLVDLATSVGKSHVIAFCARTTGYAKLVRSTPWQVHGLHAYIVSPRLANSGGAMSEVPRALGVLLAGYLQGDGVPATVGEHAVEIEKVTR